MRFGPGRAKRNRDVKQLVVSSYSELRKFAAVVGDIGDDPDDLLQEALVSVLKSTELTEVSDPLDRMKVAVMNRALSNRRSASRRTDEPSQATTPSVHDDQSSLPLLGLAALSIQDRAIVCLAEFDGYAHEEIGRVLNLTVPTVSRRLNRARRKLREYQTERGMVVGHVLELGL